MFLSSLLSLFKHAPSVTLVDNDWVTICLPLTALSEGCKLTAYPDPASGGDPWTIGYGATGPDIHAGLVWTQEQAVDRLHTDLMRFGAAVDGLVKVEMSPWQKAALVDFAYNLGAGALASSTLLKLLNAGDMQGAAMQFNVWVKASGKIMPGLVTRRQRETDLFTKGSWT